MFFGYIILLTAVLLSGIAAFYSVAGLTAIFAAATIPIIIMGGALEFGKIVATVWLHNNWKRVPRAFKAYLIPAVVFLMLLTSMGIYGFLSRAHSDHSLVSGDVQAKIAVYDDQIRIEKENIEANRKALKQMDEGVDQVLSRSTNEQGASKAIAVRKSQARERTRIQTEIAASQKIVSTLSAERAPIAAEVRKVEAEVGPIKYIAALLYGDNPDSNTLERSVRVVIILIVLVFDPLALTLILAANKQLEWAREDRKIRRIQEEDDRINLDKLRKLDEDEANTIVVTPAEPEKKIVKQKRKKKEIILKGVNTEFAGEGIVTAAIPGDVSGDNVTNVTTDTMVTVVEKVMVPNIEPELGSPPPIAPAPVATIVEPIDYDDSLDVNVVSTTDSETDELKRLAELEKETETATSLQEIIEQPTPMVEVIEDVVDPNTRVRTKMHNWVPDTSIKADNVASVLANFGTNFPPTANKGDMYLRVDFLPNKLFKFNGTKWMEVNKENTDSYAYNEEYIKYLIEKVDSGEYSTDDLTATEQDQIKEYLNK